MSVFCDYLSEWPVHRPVVQAQIHSWFFPLLFQDLIESIFKTDAESDCFLLPPLLPSGFSNHQLCLDDCRDLLIGLSASALMSLQSLHTHQLESSVLTVLKLVMPLLCSNLSVASPPTQSKSKVLSMTFKPHGIHCLSLPVSLFGLITSHSSLMDTASATLDSLLFLKHIRHTRTPGPLHLLFSLPWHLILPQISSWLPSSFPSSLYCKVILSMWKSLHISSEILPHQFFLYPFLALFFS